MHEKQSKLDEIYAAFIAQMDLYQFTTQKFFNSKSEWEWQEGKGGIGENAARLSEIKYLVVKYFVLALARQSKWNHLTHKQLTDTIQPAAITGSKFNEAFVL